MWTPRRTSAGQSPGVLDVVGDLSLAANGALDIEIGGATAGTGAGFHDQVNVTGTVTIGSNVTLSTSSFGGFVPSDGQPFVIINNDGADAVSGTFAGASA